MSYMEKIQTHRDLSEVIYSVNLTQLSEEEIQAVSGGLLIVPKTITPPPPPPPPPPPVTTTPTISSDGTVVTASCPAGSHLVVMTVGDGIVIACENDTRP